MYDLQVSVQVSSHRKGMEAAVQPQQQKYCGCTTAVEELRLVTADLSFFYCGHGSDLKGGFRVLRPYGKIQGHDYEPSTDAEPFYRY